jgi:hypothetical protein
MNEVVENSGAQENHFIDVQVETYLFVDSDYKNAKLVKHRSKIPTQSVLPIKLMSALITPNRTEVRKGFLDLISEHTVGLTEAMLCSPLSAILVAEADGLHVSIGSRQGLENNRLAVVSNESVPWTILRVVEASSNTALLKPLNRKRSLSQLNGKKVSFLEYD